jgi:hypothetical protein
MFTEYTASMANDLAKFLPEGAINAVMGVIGNCQLPLQHRAPVLVNVENPQALPIPLSIIVPPLDSPRNSTASQLMFANSSPQHFPGALIAQNIGSYIDPDSEEIRRGVAFVSNGVAVLNGDAVVAGNTWLQGDVNVAGDTTIDGDTVIEGDQVVNGGSVFNGDTVFNGNVTFPGGSPVTVNSAVGSGITVAELTDDDWWVSTNFTTASNCGITLTPSVANTSIGIAANLTAAAGITIGNGAGTAKTIGTNLSATFPIVITAGAGTELIISLDDTGYSDEDITLYRYSWDEETCEMTEYVRTLHIPAAVMALGVTISSEVES